MKMKLNTPIMVASGTYGYGDEVKGLADVANIGAIITKSVTRHPREGNPPPRISEEKFGMLNSIGLANLGVEKFLTEKIPVINSLETDVIINVAGSKIDDYVESLGGTLGEELLSIHKSYLNVTKDILKKDWLGNPCK